MIVDIDKIMEAKEILGDEQAHLIAEMLQLEGFDANNLKAKCCFHEEDTPSLVYNKKNHSYHCFGCSKNVDLINCLMMKKGMTFIEAVQELFELAGVQYSFGEHGVKTRTQFVYPEEESKENDMTQVYEYLASRGISKETVDYCDVRATANDKHKNVVFNFYDTRDVLCLVKYRPTKEVKKGDPKTWKQKDADVAHLLFNMNRINPTEPLIICEGEIDAMTCIECGFQNTVSIPFGASDMKWIAENYEFLEQFKEIIFCGDNDQPGQKMVKDASYRLGSWRCKIVEIPQVKIRGGKNPKYVKDINDVLIHQGRQEVINLINSAAATPVPSLVAYSDIKEKDLSDVDGVGFGIQGLNKELMRLYFGTFNLVGGTPGSGKTSFLCQLACQALEEDQKVFLYSRELPDWMLKNWINFILAGPRHLDRYQTDDHSEYYKVQPEMSEIFNNYYGDNLLIYRDEFPNTVEDIKVSMEAAARQFGVTTFILDNLTCIDLSSNENNQFQKQTEFANWLIQFSVKYNVATLLVVHPRKMQDSNATMSIYDYSGSSNLSNLAHRAFSLRRVTKQEKEGVKKANGQGYFKEPNHFDSMINVIKDRMRGRAGYECGMYYDRASRRFYTTPEEYDRQYAWDDTEYTTTLPYPPEERLNPILGRVSE